MAEVFSIKGSLRAKASLSLTVAIVLVILPLTIAAPRSELWMNPCSNHPVRHVRSTAEKELNFFITTLNKDMFRELKSLYPKEIKKAKGNCPKIKRLIRPINRASNITEAHKKFHMAMIEIAAFLDKLKDMPIRTNSEHFNVEKRRAIYERTKNTLRLTICEFNETMQNEFKVQPYTVKPPRDNTACLPKEADLSRIQMLDMQFFKKLKRFFRAGKSALKEKKAMMKRQRYEVRTGRGRTKEPKS